MLLSYIFNSSLTIAQKMEFILPHLAACVVIILLILPIHELAHAFVAYLFGDDTAKRSGRLTFNPLASVDPLGAIFIFLFSFGWARPVPVNPNNFKHKRAGMALTSLAGPLSNVIVALIMGIAYWAVVVIWGINCPQFVYEGMGSFITINISLAVFNLLPIPPLDGSKIVGAFLPASALKYYYKYQNIFVIVMFVLLISGVLSRPLNIAENGLLQGVMWIAKLPFLGAGI